MRTHGRALAGEAISDKISGKKLEKEGVISLEKKEICIRNSSKLAELAGVEF